MLSTGELERALAAAGLVAPVHFEEVTGSTNRTAWDLAVAGAPEWTLVAAGHQTAGRGRLDRTWEDVPGRSLLFSVVLRPTWLPPDRAGVIPLAAGLAMTEAARAVTELEVRCKWPNDLLVDDRKVGGILVESQATSEQIDHAIVGVGVNLDPPTDVELATGLGAVGPAALLGAFLRSFVSLYASNASAFIRSVVGVYRTCSATIGRDVEATTTDGRRVIGKAVGVDDAGSLVVETPEGRVWIASGDVIHLR